MADSKGAVRGAAKSAELQQIAMRIAQRLLAIAVKETIPVGKGSKRWRRTTKRGRVIEGGHDKQGGELRRSISVSKLDGGAVVGTNKVYARAVHEGRKALVIRPKKKRALAWNQGRSLAKKVVQPQRSGKPFFREAIDAFEANLDNETASLALDERAAEWLKQALESKGLRVESKG